jgi:hypothetical protein
MAKDNWDKFDIFFKTLILGIIPIAIGLAASNVADSIKRGQLIQSLVATLSEKDSKRDISLVALNEAIKVRKKCILFLFACKPDTDNDPVSQIAALLIKNSIEEAKTKNQQPRELPVAIHILTKSERADPAFYERELGNLLESARFKARSNNNAPPTPKQIAESANISQALATLALTSESTQVKGLEGVRLVFIQYENQAELAKKIQSLLKNENVSAPGTERVPGIQNTSIRYSGPPDLKAAEKLQRLLQTETSVKIEKLIDLSQSGYSVPKGQLEVWIQ